MQRIYINGEPLELPLDFSLSIERTNFLFAFDEVSCDRSTSFDVPKTANNDRLLLLSGDPNTDGAMMRTRVAARLEDGVMSWDGLLFVNSYSHRDRVYSCNFIFGDLLPLAQIKQAGTLNELGLGDTGVCKYSSDPSDRVSAALPNLPGEYTPVAYSVVSEDDDPLSAVTHPSFDMQYLLDRAASRLGTSIDYPQLVRNYRLISGEVNGVRALGVMTQVDTADLQAETHIDLDAACLNGSIWSEGFIQLRRRFGLSDELYKIRAYKAEAHITLTFSTGEPYYRLIWNDPLPSYRGISYQDNTPISAGKVYDVPRGTILAVVDDRNFVEVDQQTGAGYYSQFALSPASNPRYRIEAAGDMEDGQWVRGADNVPEIDFVTLLRTFATLEGKVVTYDAARNIFGFDDLDWSGWQRISIGNIIEVGAMERTVQGWGQRNIVAFDSSDEVRYKDKAQVVYNIDNTNIEEEVELQVMPMSEGRNEGGDLATNGEELTIGAKATPPTTAMRNMQHVTVPSIQAYSDLATASTSIEIKALFSSVDFARLTDKTLILYRNALYIWLSAEWEGGVVSLNLAKIY